MKRYFSILCTILPMVMVAQDFQPEWIEPGKLSLGVNLGTVYDTDFSRLNLNDLSAELSSDLSDDPSYSYLLSLNYQVTQSLSFGINWGNGEIYGKNGTQYFNGEFSQTNFTTRLQIFSLTPKTTAYGGVGIGIINYTATRSFVFDDVIFLEDEGESIKTSISVGLECKVNDKLSILADASYDRVADDSFDSWDSGVGHHKFLYTSFGLRFSLGGKSEDKSVDKRENIEEFSSFLMHSYKEIEN